MNINKDVINICHVISGDIWGGAEAQSFSLIKALSRREGVNVEVIVFNAGDLYNKLLSENITTYLVEEDNRSFIEIALRIYRKIKQNKAKIVHVHGFKENLTAGIAARFCSTICIRTHHGKGMIQDRGLHTNIEKVNEKLFSSGLIAVSEDLKRYLLKHRYNASKIRVIRNGIDCQDQINNDSDELKKSIGIENNERVIGIVGRLVPVKNHRCFLDSAKLILNNRSDVFFVVVGNGPLLDILKDYTKSLGIERKVKFVGFQSNVKKYLEMFDILAITSFHEGIPISMLEAMCAGVPVVSVKVGGIPEIIINEYNGLLASENNSNELSRAYVKLIENTGLYEDLSRNSVIDMRHKYSLDSCVSETIRFYQSFLV